MEYLGYVDPHWATLGPSLGAAVIRQIGRLKALQPVPVPTFDH